MAVVRIDDLSECSWTSHAIEGRCAGRGERRIVQMKRMHRIGRVKHVGDSHRPCWTVRMRAENGDRTLSKTQERLLHTLCPQAAGQAFEGKALAKSAQVDTHSLALEADGMSGFIEVEALESGLPAGFLDGLPGWFLSATEMFTPEMMQGP